MSADNYLLVTKDFRVLEGCASVEEDPGYEVGRGETLEQAVSIASEYMRNNIVEYGISFE